MANRLFGRKKGDEKWIDVGPTSQLAAFQGMSPEEACETLEWLMLNRKGKAVEYKIQASD